MDMSKRILLCLGILLIDLSIFFLPLTALFLIYILLSNPPWFREFLNNLDKPAWPIIQQLNRSANSEKEKRIMECNKEQNLETCNCTYDPCSRKGICCECISYHLKMRELPGCCFSASAEATYDRSFEHFARLVKAGDV